MRGRSLRLAAALALAALSGAPTADGQVVTWSVRSRVESWHWFDAADGDGDYTYVGTLARVALASRPAPARRVAWTVEGAVPLLLALPDDAIAPAPRGQLGLGAAYYAANDRERNVIAAFVKQAFVRVGAAPGRGGQAVRVGRFEFSEGGELAARDPTLAAVKRDRVAQRLVGPFGWTHVGRSFDGAHYTRVRPPTDRAAGDEITAVAAFPTEGAFRASAWRPLEVAIAYGAYTRSGGTATQGRGALDARAFALYYADWRPLAPVDNRPAAERNADMHGVRLTTVGAHALWVRATPVGTVDALAWGARQLGDWGRLRHDAGAGALELGLQPRVLPSLRPWLRVWYFRGGGDGDAADDEHGTFFETLPTPRPYARFPFHDLMNVDQLAATLILRPSARVTMRTDAQSLRLASAADLWYSGGGAFERTSFGYAGRPSGGARPLASLWDASVDVRVTPRLSVNGYLARAGARDVVRGVYPNTGPAWLGYVELEVRR